MPTTHPESSARATGKSRGAIHSRTPGGDVAVLAQRRSGPTSADMPRRPQAVDRHPALAPRCRNPTEQTGPRPLASLPRPLRGGWPDDGSARSSSIPAAAHAQGPAGPKSFAQADGSQSPARHPRPRREAGPCGADKSRAGASRFLAARKAFPAVARVNRDTIGCASNAFAGTPSYQNLPVAHPPAVKIAPQALRTVTLAKIGPWCVAVSSAPQDLPARIARDGAWPSSKELYAPGRLTRPRRDPNRTPP